MEPEMWPKLIFGGIAAAIIAALVYAYSDELFSTLLDKETQNEIGELLGVTKAGKKTDWQ